MSSMDPELEILTPMILGPDEKWQWQKHKIFPKQEETDKSSSAATSASPSSSSTSSSCLSLSFRLTT